MRRAVRSEVRRTRRTARYERPYVREPADESEQTEQQVMTETAGAPCTTRSGGCGPLPRSDGGTALPKDLTYREIAGELGISQGSLWVRNIPDAWMSASIALSGGCGPRTTGIGVGDDRWNR